jgi:hypothetical protein
MILEVIDKYRVSSMRIGKVSEVVSIAREDRRGATSLHLNIFRSGVA